MKKLFAAFSLFLVMLCCICAVSAVSDDMENAALTDTDESNQALSADSCDVIGESDSDAVSLSDDETKLKNTDKDVKTSSKELTPYQKFDKDLDGSAGTVYLTDDIKISKTFDIHRNVVIDGQGHSIDAQHKSRIFNIHGTVTLKNLVLKNGKADEGGAVLCYGKLTIDKCTFTNNVAKSNGGAVAVANGKLTVKNSKFTNNKVTSSGYSCYGGALWIYMSSSSISKTTFTSNSCISKSLKKHSKATKYKFSGGAIMYSAGSKHTLTQCTFTKNSASNHGGAIFVYNSNSLKIKKCTFTKNRAKFEDGGAISFAGKKLTVTNSKFKKNLAFEDGGAIDSFSVSGKKIHITIKNSQFTSNTGYKCGGAIWMGIKTVYKVTSTKFIKNQATSAGAIEAEDGSAKIIKCLFKSNKAKKVTSWTVKTKAGGRLSNTGGAILVKNKCTITKCKFKGNKAKYGNNIKVEGGKLKRK